MGNNLEAGLHKSLYGETMGMWPWDSLVVSLALFHWGIDPQWQSDGMVFWRPSWGSHFEIFCFKNDGAPSNREAVNTLIQWPDIVCFPNK